MKIKSFFLLSNLMLMGPQAYAQKNQDDLDKLKNKTPYCVDSVDNIDNEVRWYISNSCYKSKKEAPVADTQVVSTEEALPESPVIVLKNHHLFSGASINHYNTDILANSLTGFAGYKRYLDNFYEIQASLEIEKLFAIESKRHGKKIKKFMYNPSIIGKKQIDQYKLGLEIGRKHYLQFFNIPQSIQIDFTSFLVFSAFVQYSFSNKLDLGLGTSYLKANDDINSKGYEFRSFGNYLINKDHNLFITPQLSFASIKNSISNITNIKAGLSIRIDF